VLKSRMWSTPKRTHKNTLKLTETLKHTPSSLFTTIRRGSNRWAKGRRLNNRWAKGQRLNPNNSASFEQLRQIKLTPQGWTRPVPTKRSRAYLVPRARHFHSSVSPSLVNTALSKAAYSGSAYSGSAYSGSALRLLFQCTHALTRTQFSYPWSTGQATVA
jgi:hypothetical protein